MEKKPKNWWSEVKRAYNFKTKREPVSLTNVEVVSNLTQIEQANEINTSFLNLSGKQATISTTKVCVGRNASIFECIRNEGAKSFIKTSNEQGKWTRQIT